MRKLFERYRELISYGFWGAATTVVNYIVYFLCTRALAIDPVPSNIAAWCAAVVFAYVVNKLFVFESRSWRRSVVFREVWQFVSARLLSGALETLGVFVFVTLLHFHDAVVKIALSVLVVLANYVLSKWIVFRKPKDGQD